MHCVKVRIASAAKVLVPVHVILQHDTTMVIHMCLLSDCILCTTGCVVFVDFTRVVLVPMHSIREP